MNRIVEFALKQRAFVVIMMLAVFAAGVAAFIKLNIEAYPDPVPPLVDIIAQSPGLSAEEMERYVTIPIEVQMAGIPNVKAIRTISLFGLSDVKLQFTYDFTYRQAEQWVVNRLAQLPPLPNGVQPAISPWSPIGEIFRYQLKGPPGYSVTDLKTLQDWVLQRRFKAIPGVVDVNGWGGKTKTYEVSVDAAKLAANGLTLPQLLQALNNSNINVGGQTVDIGPQAAVVRGVGQIKSVDDIRGTMLANNKGVPVLVGDVATVSVGHQPRLGIAGHDFDDDVVEGIVLMRRGEQSMPTIERVKAEVDKINAGNLLPPGVHIERIYDRSDLIRTTTHTVLHNMVFGVALIFLLQWAFLGNLRSAVIVAATIPFALSFAIALMVLRGESANLLSVGAIDFGLVVDATVIMVENIFRHLAQHAMGHFEGDPLLHRLRAAVGLHGKFAVIANSATEVNRAIVFSAAIIIAGFLPLFTLSGIEGHIFGPMAKTYAYAIAGGLIATFTISPALSSYLLAEHAREEKETPVSRYLRQIYTPAVEYALKHRRVTLAGAAVLVVVALLAARSLGLEFLPKLEEGNLWIRATMPPSISLAEGDAYVNGMRTLIKSYPEVETVVSQHGRPDDGTDATGFFNAEFFVPLKPADDWPAGVDKDKLTEDMTAALAARYPGVEFNFSQYIQDNVEEAASGVKGENSIKLFGNDLDTLEKTAQQIKDVMGTVPGVADLAVFNSLGQPTVRIDVDRARAARYGLMPGDVNATIQAAIGGQAAGDLYEPGSDRHYPIMVRMAPEYRGSIDAIKRILLGVPNPNGGVTQVPLAEVASVHLVSGASFIYREGQERYIPIKFSVRGRDLGSAVLEAQRKVSEQVKLPGGYRLEWVGEFGNLEEAMSRLAVVVPLAIGLICLLLYANFGNLVDVALAASVIPMAMIGGVLALFVTGTPFSVSAAIGFVALFGIAAMDGIIVLSFFNQELDGGLTPYDAIRRTCQVQMRPVVMTCVVACVGLVPAAISTGIGSQVQKPLALVVVGGIILAPLLILIVLPVLIDAFSRQARQVEKQSGEAKP
ncbi:MAG TPA: CusA/CzcA family heavy metal efflux RND transporter [Rhodocyclaceae bacterium]